MDSYVSQKYFQLMIEECNMLCRQIAQTPTFRPNNVRWLLHDSEEPEADMGTESWNNTKSHLKIVTHCVHVVMNRLPEAKHHSCNHSSVDCTRDE